MKKIIPSLIATTQEELDKRFNIIKNYFKIFHLDIMDGKFVKNKSLFFDFKMPKKEFKYETHLMLDNPKKWIEKNWKKSGLIIFHIEALKSEIKVKEIIKLIKSKRRKVGIAISPKTEVKKIIPYLDLINRVLIMSVNPGRYGSEFIPDSLNKIKEIKKLKPKLKISVDGGINNKSILKISKAGADLFVVGSYLQKSRDIKKDIKKLRKFLIKR